jgi:hypothetical protein
MRRVAGELNRQRSVGVEHDVVAVDAYPYRVAEEDHPHLDLAPLVGEARVDDQDVAPGTEPEKAVCDRLPHATHGREVQTTTTRRREVGEIDLRRESQGLDRLVETVGASEE